MKQILYSQDLSGLVDSISDLPSFPGAIQRASALVQDPRASAADLAAVIEIDPALTARVLRVTNSAFYGLSGQISTVKDGVVVLGFSAVRTLAVAVSAMKMFTIETSACFNHEQFWMHSACCAVVAQRLVKRSSFRLADDAFTAALLHDMGKIVLDQYAHDDFVRLLFVQKKDGRLDTQTERKLFNTDHAELGRKLTERWHLPPSLSQSIGWHHDGLHAADGKTLAMVSQVADYICTANGPRVGYRRNTC